MHCDMDGRDEERMILTPTREEREALERTLKENPDEFDSPTEQNILMEHLDSTTDLKIIDSLDVSDSYEAPMFGYLSCLRFLGFAAGVARSDQRRPPRPHPLDFHREARLGRYLPRAGPRPGV